MSAHSLSEASRRVGIVLALGGLLVVLDTTVTIVALPRIVADLHSTLPTVQWITTGYLLAIVAVTPVAGWLANTFGARRVYAVALVGFTVFSVLSGAAWGVGSLIAFRVCQGLAGGLLNPVGQAIGLRAVARDSRGRMMSMLGLPVVIGPVLGPPLSGWLVDAASWRWIFWVNLPVGVAALALCLAFVPSQAPDRRTPLDWWGLALLPTGGVLVVLACTFVGEAGSPTVPAVASGAAGLALLAGFVVRALRTRHPLLQLRLLRHRPLAAGTATLFCFGAAYFGGMTILPIFVQGVRGDSALVAGLIGIPQALATGITLQVATRLVDRVPPRRIVLTGVSLGLAGSVALLLALRADASYAVVMGAAAVLGVGSGATLMPAMTVATRDLEGAETPAGTTVVGLVQQLASSLGAAVVAATLTVLVADRAPRLGGEGLGAMLSLSGHRRAALLGELTSAVGSTYAVVAVLMLLALLVAAVSLREVSP